MTEYWKSNPMHWCDVCKCWMQDNKQARLNHERGMGHKANLAKKLRDMSKASEKEKQMQKQATATMAKIEDAAQKKYEEDLKAMQALTGKWEWDHASCYYYNQVHRWYYDPETKWYYGGEPVEWTQTPQLPENAKFGMAPHEGGPVPVTATAPTSSKPTATAPSSKPTAAASACTASHASASTSSTAAPGVRVVKKVIELPKHPLMYVGGHQAPTIGKVGAAKGVALLGPAGGGGKPGDKRKRDGEQTAKAVTPEEAEALARREAAQQRVQQRTASTFGYV